VGNVLFNYRMFLMHKDARYLDVAEVALLNNVLAAVNLEGNRFFYVNPLEADGKYPFNHGTAGRAPWFGTACCPSNMARLLPQVPGMTYAHDDRDIYITFYAASRTKITLGDVNVELQQQTGLVAMCGHTRRFNPSHQFVRRRIAAGELALQHLVADTFFFRRTNMNAAGQPRSWSSRTRGRRRAAGAIPRQTYEAGSLSQTRPWEAHGMSRASWYRAGKPE
jgi:hypothetical protein